MGAGSLASTIRSAIGNGARFQAMREFFDGVGTGHASGYGFTETPVDRPEVKERFRMRMAAQAKKRKAEEMV